MHIVTSTCEACGTIVAANELERERCMKCPGLDCQVVHRFEDLPEADREHVRSNLDQCRG